MAICAPKFGDTLPSFNAFQIATADVMPCNDHEVIRRGLSVRDTERLVKRLAAGRSKKTEQPTDPNVRSLEKELTDKLGARVSIRQSASGKGKLEILYNNLDELDGILAHIK